MEGNGTLDYAAWVKEGETLGRELRMQEEDVLGVLSMEPARAADAMVSLFEAIIDRIEDPLLGEDELTPDEVAKLRAEQAVALTRFWKRCDELAGMIVSHPSRSKPARQ